MQGARNANGWPGVRLASTDASSALEKHDRRTFTPTLWDGPSYLQLAACVRTTARLAPGSQRHAGATGYPLLFSKPSVRATLANLLAGGRSDLRGVGRAPSRQTLMISACSPP